METRSLTAGKHVKASSVLKGETKRISSLLQLSKYVTCLAEVRGQNVDGCCGCSAVLHSGKTCGRVSALNCRILNSEHQMERKKKT